MTFRRKLLVVFALTVFLSVGVVALLVLGVTRNAFEKTEEQRTAALVTQFQREFDHRGDEVTRRVRGHRGFGPGQPDGGRVEWHGGGLGRIF